MYSTYDVQVSSSALGAFSTTTLLVSLVVAVLMLVSCWKMYQKAGEPGWAVLVPFYSTYVGFKIAYGNGWKMLLMLIPIVNIVVSIQYSFKMAKAFGQSTGFGLGLLFLPVVFMPLLAFKKDVEYVGPAN